MDTPTNGDLLAAALGYARRGWSVIPVNSDKTPSLRSWKAFQEQRPTKAQLGEMFDNLHPTGIAVICGRVSGDLCIADFDDLDAYNTWAERYPDLATALPTVETARGRHVYFRCADIRKKRWPDGRGDLCGEGAYCLLPPSRHRQGHIYRWIVPLPEGDLPGIDPDTCGLIDGITENGNRYIHKHDCNDSVVSDDSIDSIDSVSPDIKQVITQTLPTREGQRNACIFSLARHIKGIPAFADAEVGQLREIVRRWHRWALPVIGTKPFEDTWSDFIRAWRDIRFPAGQDALMITFQAAQATPMPKVVENYDCPKTRHLIRFCRELQRASNGQPFFLSCRSIARMFEIPDMTAWRRLDVLCEDGVLEVVKPGTRGRNGKATRYRYLPDLDA